MRTDRNKNTFKRYTEAGLAVLIVLTLGLAGATGALTPHAAESEQTELSAGVDSAKSSESSESSGTDAEAQETIADGQYPIMGSSDITVQEMVDYFNASGEEYPAEELSEGGADSIETFCQMYYDEATVEGVRVPGNSYPDVQTGIRAQIQHLKAYATSDALNQECVDDRYEYVKKGSAPYVQWLGQQENPEGLGWATGDNYGYDIVGMIEEMM